MDSPVHCEPAPVPLYMRATQQALSGSGSNISRNDTEQNATSFLRSPSFYRAPGHDVQLSLGFIDRIGLDVCHGG